MRINSIALKMILPLVLITFVVVGAILTVTQTYVKQVAEDIFIKEHAAHLQTIYNLKLKSVLSDIKNNGIAVASSKDVKDFLLNDLASKAKMDAQTKAKLAKLKNLHALENIYVADIQNKNYFDENGFVKQVDTDGGKNSWFTETLKSEKKYLINIDSDIKGSLHIWSDALVENNGKILGLAGCGMDINNIYDLATEHFSQGSAEVLILNSSELVIGSSSDKSLINTPFSKPELYLKKEGVSLVEYNNDAQEQRYMLFMRLNELDYTVVIDFPKEEFLKELYGVYDKIIIGGAILLFLLLIAGGLVYTYLFSIPLKRVAETVSSFDHSGELDLKRFKSMGYEIEMICDAFTKSSELLRSLNDSLELRVQEKTTELERSNKLLSAYVSELEGVNLELVKSRKEAQLATQARSNFISGISHELRTPLNAIINFTDQLIEDFDEILEDKDLQDDARIFLARVLQNSRHLLQLINDLLDFTKAEVGKMSYEIQNQDINKILKIAYSNTYSLLNGSELDFRLKLCEDPLFANVDSRRFLQIMLNLLSNSIKFTKSGFIEIRSYKDGNRIVVEVQDSGSGIPQEKQKIIFDPFVQVKSIDNGTGLGLGLAKKMCEDMGIDISFSSTEDIGTTFSLSMNLDNKTDRMLHG
jgi:signal transduction histidine kinase